MGSPLPQFDECTHRPEVWKLPPQGSQIRLAFVWNIVQRRRVERAQSCVVRLDHAEQRGVPLPPDLAPVIADLLCAGTQDKGASLADQCSVASQPSFGTFASARTVAMRKRTCCRRRSATGRAQGGGDRERPSE